MADTRKKALEVSIIVPCYNEEKTIQLLLQAILEQNFPIENMEVVIADSMSVDRTRERIEGFSRSHPELGIRIVNNPQKTIPAAVNAAVDAAAGEIIVRMDAHSAPNREYISTSVDLLKSGKAENVGGVWEIQPGEDTCIAAAISRAAAHPLGAGDANYRVGRQSGYVDTVPFGAFKRAFFIDIGKFNEKMLANEDYEFNTRIKRSGGRIWLDTRIRSKYFARKTLKALAKQYWRYGYWKFKMLRKFPESLRWRQAVPPLFVFWVLSNGLLAFFIPIARIIFTVSTAVYLAVLTLASLVEAIKKKNPCFFLMAFAFMTMHFSWGGGFIYSLFK